MKISVKVRVLQTDRWGTEVVSEVHEEIRYSARLSGYTDRTWLQCMCCTYSDILSLYFRWRDRLRFVGGDSRRKGSY